ncbi:MAG: DUF3369 domain-containing protein [Pseudomonadales bacterium]|nr:DUF3369 domain-containing protein [Pseudomonadales bacterium]
MASKKNPLFAKKKKSNKGSKTTAAPKPPQTYLDNWKILIVDDEPEVHTVTKMVLQDYQLMGRGLDLYHAYSAAEARDMLKKEKNYALALVDVVMETDEAGLQLVKYIREELKNHHIRLVLRTGQPGFAPEKDVIRDYDINDYKDKTELTEIKLHTLMCSALRSFEDIKRLDQNRIGLEMVINASANIFESSSLQTFTSAVLMQLMGLIDLSNNAVMVTVSGFSATEDKNQFDILAGVGDFDKFIGSKKEELPSHVLTLLEQAVSARRSIYETGQLVLYSETLQGNHHLLFLQHYRELNKLDENLIELFCANVSIAYENHMLRAEIDETQREIVCILSEAIENRSKESGNHIYRVAEMTSILALAYGYSEEEAERIKAAAPLHDVGKVGIPDDVLHKPGKLVGKEWETMKTHVDMGYDLLKSSRRKILEYAAIIAHEHHERWDGDGYPQGLVGDEIHILGRIVSLVDVFDALSSKRCYKDAWPIEKAIDFIKQGAGTQFDPEMVDLFLANQQQLQQVCERFTDAPH